MEDSNLKFRLLATWALADEYLPKEQDLWDSKTLGESQASVQRRQESVERRAPAELSFTHKASKM